MTMIRALVRLWLLLLLLLLLSVLATVASSASTVTGASSDCATRTSAATWTTTRTSATAKRTSVAAKVSAVHEIRRSDSLLQFPQRRFRGGGAAFQLPKFTKGAASSKLAPKATTTTALAATSSSSSTSSPPGTKASSSSRPKKLILWTGISVVAVGAVTAVLFQEPRPAWLALLLDKQRLQEIVVQALQGLRPEGSDGGSSWSQCCKAYSQYAAGMMVWEFLGLSTIPVETAAGMVFGWHAAAASAVGKLLGASLAYATGRTVLQTWVQKRFLKDNEMCQLLADNSRDLHAPFLSALLMKFSCFPETIKNFGTAAFLPSVTFPWFFLATFFHGCMFTLLWTWLGVETSQQIGAAAGSALAAATAKNSKGLQLALTLMIFMGFVLSPLSMAWWVHDLRKGAAAKKQQQQLQQQQQQQQS